MTSGEFLEKYPLAAVTDEHTGGKRGCSPACSTSATMVPVDAPADRGTAVARHSTRGETTRGINRQSGPTDQKSRPIRPHRPGTPVALRRSDDGRSSREEAPM